MLLLLATALADCPSPSTPPMLIGAVVQGENAVRSGDRMALNNAAAAARTHLKCLDRTIGMREVAAVYRLWGYAAFVERDNVATERWLAAAKDLEPGYALPAALFPEFHPLRALYEDLEISPPTSQGVLDVPEGYSTRVNGVETTVYARGRPWVLQQLDSTGAVVLSTIVAPETGVPALVGPPKETLPVGMSVLGAPTVWQRQGRSTGTFGPALRVTVPFNPVFDLDTRVALGFSAVKEGFVMVPELRLGGAWTLDDELGARVGAGFLLSSHADAVVAPGAVLTAGLAPKRLDIELQGGWSGGIVVGLGIGARLTNR